MAFPESILDVKIELYLDGTWTDVTPYVYTANNISITRGRKDESGQVDPTKCRLTMNNRDGRFSPRNPTGPYYGMIGRNTPLRVSVANGPGRLRVPGPPGQFFAPDSSALSITGDIELQVDVKPSTWRPVVATYLGVYKQLSYGLYITSDGLLGIHWWSDATTEHDIVSVVPVPGNISGRKSVRATLDVNNGASGRTAHFYYSDDNTISGTWVLFDTVVDSASTTSIHDDTNTLGTFSSIPLEIYALKVVSGLGGTEVANPDFVAQTPGVLSFADAAGNTWSISGTDVGVDNRHYRFWGEVANWPQTWDTTGRDVRTSIEAASIIRRLTAGSSALQSTLRRSIPQTNVTNLIQYWPLEDQKNSQTVAAVVGKSVMRYRGTPSFAAYTGFVCSAPVVTLGSSRIYGAVDPYADTGVIQVRFMANIPAATPDNAILARIFTAGTASWWDIIYNTGGGMTLKAYDNNNTNVLNAGPFSFDVNDKNLRIYFAINNSGSDVHYALATYVVEAPSVGGTSGTLSGKQIGRCTAIDLNPAQAAIGSVSVGHLTVENSITTVFDLTTQINAYAGELSITRINRLCTEEGVAVRIIGGGDGDTAYVGYQTVDTLVNLLKDAAFSDNGVLYEPRDAYGLQFRSLSSMINQDATCTIDYTSGALDDFQPVEDDQSVRNDVTITRNSGSSFRAVQEHGSLSVQQPPDGVGRYTTALSLSLYTDASTEQQAGWRLHLGTVDEARYPSVGVKMANRYISATPALIYQLLSSDIGDRLVITDSPAWMPPEDVSLLIQGYTETINSKAHDIKFNCVPENPYHVAVYSNTASRYDSNYSTLAEDLTTVETGVDVAISAGPLWTTDNGDMPFDIMVAGERMSVTAISGSSSPQTFTVTRSVNGIVKTQATGAGVSLFRPVYYGLHGARVLGGSATTGDETTPLTANAAQFTTGSCTINAINPTAASNPPGAPYPGFRGVDQLCLYQTPLTVTVTNQYGCEVAVNSSGVITAVNDRQTTGDTNGTAIPSGGYVLSGHGTSRTCLLDHAVVGQSVTLVTDTGPGTGGGGSSGAFPTTVIAGYKMLWSSSPAAPFNTMPSAVNVVNLAFANGSSLSLVGYGPEGQSTMLSQAAAWRTGGKRIHLSVGGAGYTVPTADRTTFLQGVASIKTQLEGAGAGLDGLDWDVEAGTTAQADIVYLSTQLKNLYGTNFAITFAPNGSNQSDYRSWAVACNNAGALDMIGQQYYDAVVSLSAAKSNISAYIGAGIPASKMAVGMSTESSVSGGFWSVSTAQTNMADIYATFGIRKCYMWQAGMTAFSSWVSAMDTVLP